MGGFGIEKILLVMVVVLLLFGAKRLPEIGASLGKGIREFKGSLGDVHDAISEPMARAPLPQERVTRQDDVRETAPVRLDAGGGRDQEPKRLLS